MTKYYLSNGKKYTRNLIYIDKGEKKDYYTYMDYKTNKCKIQVYLEKFDKSFLILLTLERLLHLSFDINESNSLGIKMFLEEILLA